MTGKVEEIGQMVLANDGTSSDPKRGDYTAKRFADFYEDQTDTLLREHDK